ncbi:NUAK1 family protein [Megaselia abdita]
MVLEKASTEDDMSVKSQENIMCALPAQNTVKINSNKKKLKQRFDILKKLGQGTYGKVQLAINKETGQEVAIKTIKKCKIESDGDLIRIRREVQIMSSVQHPNIIHIYEVFENRDKIVLVMEYAAGGELYDYLSSRKTLDENDARRIFRQISIAIYYCHINNICHRDLKLENILLDENGNAKIADFGLSNVYDGKDLLNTFCGSPLYASPEIVKGLPYQGPEVDCWSLGVLLYTLVYGSMPFDGSNFKRLVKQISGADFYEPKNKSPASVLIRAMLTADSEKRATVSDICSHDWLNQGYDECCLNEAKELAKLTPVRLDLLLSMNNETLKGDKLFISSDDQQEVNESLISETGSKPKLGSDKSINVDTKSNTSLITETNTSNSHLIPEEVLPVEPPVTSNENGNNVLVNTEQVPPISPEAIHKRDILRKCSLPDNKKKPFIETNNSSSSVDILHNKKLKQDISNDEISTISKSSTSSMKQQAQRNMSLDDARRSLENSISFINKARLETAEEERRRNAREIIGNKTSDNANVTKTSTAEIKLKSLTLPRKKKEVEILSPKSKDFAKPSFFDDFKESNAMAHSIKERFNSNESLRESLRDSNTAMPIKKSPREFIIPISVEGGGLIKPSTSSSTSTPTETKKSPFEDKFEHSFYNSGFRNNNLMRSRFSTKRRDDSESQSSDEEDDGFEILSAEKLFSTLLQRVKDLTNRLNINDVHYRGIANNSIFNNSSVLPPTNWKFNRKLKVSQPFSDE